MDAFHRKFDFSEEGEDEFTAETCSEVFLSECTIL